MTIFSYTEENYLKSIYHLCHVNADTDETSTNNIASFLNIKPATVTSMLQKLCDKKLITYKPYSKVKLSKTGKLAALHIIRKHRLWEVFLVQKLAFSWDQVHDVAEQLEHIQSEELINKLDAYLQYPIVDPHGDPIPNAAGEVTTIITKKLSAIACGQTCKVVAVSDTNRELLQFLSSVQIELGTQITMVQNIKIADTFVIAINKQPINISYKLANYISVL